MGIFKQCTTLKVEETDYWYTSNTPIKVYIDESVDEAIFRKSIRKCVKNYNLCKDTHRNQISNVLIASAKAFDELDRHSSLSKAWTALELLTGTDSNDDVIDRCKSMFYDNDKEYQLQILEGLRRYRNGLTHEGLNNLNPFILCFQIQKYIYFLRFHFHLPKTGEVNNINEINTFLDLNLQSFVVTPIIRTDYIIN